MGLIIIGILLIALFIYALKSDWHEGLGMFISVVSFICAVVAFVGGIFGLGFSYEYNLLHKTQLVEKNLGMIATIDGVREAANYYEEVELDWQEYDGNAYKPSVIIDDIIFIESDLIDVPVLQLYEKTEKKTFWTFAAGNDTRYVHVIKVPIGTVSLFANDMAIEFG